MLEFGQPEGQCKVFLANKKPRVETFIKVSCYKQNTIRYTGQDAFNCIKRQIIQYLNKMIGEQYQSQIVFNLFDVNFDWEQIASR